MSNCRVAFPAKWVDASVLEASLTQSMSPHISPRAHFVFPVGCKVMVEAAVRLLSLCNQLVHCSRSVTLEFEEGETGTMGYLNRMGFFDHLSTDVAVLPERPLFSGAAIYGGHNSGLVEIARINPAARDQELPNRLANALIGSYRGTANRNELEGAVWTIFAELIDNVFSHSSTQLDGFAAMQVYSNGNAAKVAVSDSGLGLLSTLRPALAIEFPNLQSLSDSSLMVEIFRHGISRHGTDRGCGLRGSAQKAIKYKANLEVRLANSRVRLVPDQTGYSTNKAFYSEGLPLLWGTHICFSFKLD